MDGRAIAELARTAYVYPGYLVTDLQDDAETDSLIILANVAGQQPRRRSLFDRLLHGGDGR
jgi:hypothetical protein